MTNVKPINIVVRFTDASFVRTSVSLMEPCASYQKSGWVATILA
jgi:hypothetical protein